jgi:uncharacterized protein (DUF952 family)
LPEVWAEFSNKPTYTAESLLSEGFIHCSFAAQLDGVLARYYGGVEKVLLLEIDPERLTSELKIEPSTNDELYPHIYGEINSEAVVAVTEKSVKP